MLQRMYRASIKRMRLLNVAMLIAGYGFGQGSIFLAQTWLMARGNLHLLALFGTHFSFAMFGIILTEAGSLTTLARHSASMSNEEVRLKSHEESMWRKFWEVSSFRIFLAVGVIITIVGILKFGNFDQFTYNYALCAAPAFLIWAINAGGFLDGLKLSGVSGISGSIAYISSAVALLLSENLSVPIAAILLGSAFSVGYGLTVLVQIFALRAAGWKLRFERPTLLGIVRAAKDGAALLGSTLPGQFYFRGQLLMSSAWLGVGVTAMLVYIKQVTAAAAQLVGFIRRVEFPNLVNRLKAETADPLRTVMQAQRLGTWLAVAIAAVMGISGVGIFYMRTNLSSDLGWYLFVFSFSVVLSAIVLALSQGMAAMGMYNSLFIRSVLSTIVGLILSFLLIRPLGLIAILMADVGAAVVGTAAIVMAFRNTVKQVG